LHYKSFKEHFLSEKNQQGIKDLGFCFDGWWIKSHSWTIRKFNKFTCWINWTRLSVIISSYDYSLILSRFVNEWRWTIVKRFISCQSSLILLCKTTLELFS
jgi:hypothetical protein